VSEPIHFHSLCRVVLSISAAVLLAGLCPAAPESAPAPTAKEAVKPKPAPATPVEEKPAVPAKETKAATPPAKQTKPAPPAKDTKPAPAAKPAKPAASTKPTTPAEAPATPPAAEPAMPAADDGEDPAAAENAEAETAAVAKPVGADPIQIFGWREEILIQGLQEKLKAKLDTGALTSSIHAEEKELFERDGKKWVRFIVTDPTVKKPVRTRIEAPLVRIAKIKEPGAESVAREVVRLSFQIGERKMRGEFTLNNRNNMLSPVLIGRNMIKDLGWVDPARIDLADQKIFR
jgi:hypothetical protein